MRRILITLSLITAISLGVNAQDGNSTVNSRTYKTAVGVKFYPGAITLKHFLNQKNALEFLGYFRKTGFRITGLYEIHGDLSNNGSVKWYFGPGAHVSFFSEKYGGGGSVGIDGVIGLDYKVKGAPLNLAIDWQPSFDFKDTEFLGDWFGLAVRFTF